MKLQDYYKYYKRLERKNNLIGEEALKAVKKNGVFLVFVKEQTEEICLEAVKQNGWVLKYVHEQTEKICLEAVKENGWALEYVKDQTPEICLEAVKQNGDRKSTLDVDNIEIKIKGNTISINGINTRNSGYWVYVSNKDKQGGNNENTRLL